MEADAAAERPISATEVQRLGPWFHNLHLPGGMQTAPGHPLGDFPTVKWRQIEPFIPRNLSRWRVLDVGCNAGFYSFELARRGAEVTAIDIDGRYLRQALWAAERYGLAGRIKFEQASVYSLAGATERFDLVWFLGVLYHLRHPLLALDILRGVTGRQLVLQTLTAPGRAIARTPPNFGLMERKLLNSTGWPRMAFIEHDLEDDPTNWWAPNAAAGFRVIARPGHEIYICVPDRTETALSIGLRQSELKAVFER
jgi:tRNA (mo5U34)-methyltransferase